MRFLRVVLAAMLLAPLLTAQSRAQETNSKDKTATFESKTDATKSETDIGKRLDNAASVFTEIMETPDKGIPTNVLDDAKCIAVVPSMLHIAVGFGGGTVRA